MEAYKLHKAILCIDLKSFYASVECILRGLDPMTASLVVADQSRGNKAIILAVSPHLKTLGIPSRCRLFELPKHLDIIIAKPQMQTYLNYSEKIIEIYQKYIAKEDIYIYSIDEAFLDVTRYLKMYNKTPSQLAQTILNDITASTGLLATCGIGPNMLISKLALDIESKQSKTFIAKWSYDDIPTKLWPLTPLSKMWGIGRNMERRLNEIGYYKIGDIATGNEQTLNRLFGVIGTELYYHTHGIDMSLIQDQHLIKSGTRSYGYGQTLFRDYYPPDIFQIIIEMIDDLSRKLRLNNNLAKTLHLSISYSNQEAGFSKQQSLDFPTNREGVLIETAFHLFEKNYHDYPIKKIYLSVSNIISNTQEQLNLFDDPLEIKRKQELLITMDRLKKKYGKNSIQRASSKLEESTIEARNKLIGGHNA